MKIECSCGAKYEFDLRPEMQAHPVQFVCPACGLDASEFVDGLIRRELGQTERPPGPPIPLLAATARPTSEPSPRTGVRLRTAEPIAATTPAQAQTEVARCPKHPGEVATEKCYVCSKPICPKCMALFGYVCSPLCKAKAGARGISLPVYAGQKSIVEARRWRKIVWAGSATGAFVVILLSVWFWYAWFGCLPKPVFSVRFAQPAYSGQSVVCGNHQDQIVFLHGATLARCDLKSGREIWSRQMVDPDEIQREAERELQASKAVVDKATSEAWEQIPKMPSAQEVTTRLERAAAARPELARPRPECLGRGAWQTGPLRLGDRQSSQCGGGAGRVRRTNPAR